MKTKRTTIWGEELESGDFVIVPRLLTRLGRYTREMGNQLQPRHILFLLVLVGRKFQEEPIKVTWKELARDMGAKIETVRKWGMQLKNMGFINIKYSRVQRKEGADPRNTFDIAPFVRFVNEARLARERDREGAREWARSQSMRNNPRLRDRA